MGKTLFGLKLKKIIVALLSGVLLSGCATQHVYFTSFPTGVDVNAGEKHGVTPCTLRVREDLKQATFLLPSGETQVLPMPEMDSDIKETGEGISRAAGGTLMVAGGIVGLAGLGLFLLVVSGEDDETDQSGNESSSSTNSDDYTMMGVGLAGMGLGAGVFFIGKMIYSDDDTPVLHAEFIISEDGEPTKGSDRYEDTGYGARRLKTAAP